MHCCVLSHLWLSEGRAHQLAPHSFWGMVPSKHQKYRGWSVEPATRKMPYLIPIDPLGKDFEHTYNMYKENVYAQICPFSKFMCFKLIYITYMYTCEYKLIYYIYKLKNIYMYIYLKMLKIHTYHVFWLEETLKIVLGPSLSKAQGWVV